MFVWEQLENGKWEPRLWSMARPDPNSFTAQLHSFDSIEQLRNRVALYIANIEDMYGKEARFVRVEVTKYTTIKREFTSLKEITESFEEF